MPVIESVKKALRGSEKKKVFNLRRKRTMKNVVKEITELKSSGKTDEALSILPNVYKAIDKAAKRGIIKKRTAARKKSRLARSLNTKSK